MSQCSKSRPPRGWFVALCIAVVGLIAPTPAGAISSAQCDAQVNDTPSKLLPCIQKDDLWGHMQAFQAIADANPGPDGHASRSSGEPGYKASADYVASMMKAAGYDVTLQPYTFKYFAYKGVPSFREVSPTAHDYTLNTEWRPGTSTGITTAAIQPAVQLSTPLPTMNLSIEAVIDPNRMDWNVIAVSKGGNKNHVVVVDAHLDSIYGAGMLDDASGSATILDIAQEMKNVTPLNHLRFIWFGGQHLGLLGSSYYLNSLSSNALSHIGYDLDAVDMAAPNYMLGIFDPAAPNPYGTPLIKFPNRVYDASTVARDQAAAYLDSQGKNHEFLWIGGIDSINFNLVGIPSSGIFTGQNCCKTQHEVDLFGGFTGNFEGNIPSFDGGCVNSPFRWCDNLSNNDPDVLTLASRTFANMVVQMAFDTKVMSASSSVVFNKKLPIAGEAPLGSVAE